MGRSLPYRRTGAPTKGNKLGALSIRAAFAVLLASLTGLAACAGAEDESPLATADGPGAFALRINTYLRTGQFDRAWTHLHPEQKKIVSRKSLASCWTSTSDVLGDPQVRMNVVKVFDEPWQIPGTSLTRPSKAIMVRALAPSGGGESAVVETWTQHTFRVGADGWAWIVAAPFIDDVRSAAC